MIEYPHKPSDLRLRALEYTSQILTQAPVSNVEVEPDVPMYDLAEVIYERNNKTYQPFKPNSIRYPISNDTFTARGFRETLPRTLTGEYQAAKNRVALLIGESGLAANLRYIPEDTIVMPDINPNMVKFMEIYVSGLRTADNKEQWLQLLQNNGPEVTIDNLCYQLAHWGIAGEPHPATDDEAFYEAQNLAREKAIIPLQVDVLDSGSMQWLADQLAERKSSITFMNLTNLLPCLGPGNIDLAHRNLKTLPVTSEAPILATGATIFVRPRSPEEDQLQAMTGAANHDVGPFFGLDNLARAYEQNRDLELGAVGERHYIYREHPYVNLPMLELMLVQSLAKFFR